MKTMAKPNTPQSDLEGEDGGSGAGVQFYALALGTVLVACLVRYALDPLFTSSGFIFSAFYLAVVLTAYFASAGPAIFAAALSALVAYWAFAAPSFAWKLNVEALTSMGFFCLTSTVDIYFITGMKRALERYRIEHRRAELLAEGNANLFREFSERTTNHLQLVSALLQQRANEGVDAAYRNALTEVSQSTLAVSRAHRDLEGSEQKLVDLPGLADQLLRATATAAGRADLIPLVSGVSLSLGAEQATSVATILSECFRATLIEWPQEVKLVVACENAVVDCCLMVESVLTRHVGKRLLDDFSRRIVEATTRQLCGQFSATIEGQKLQFILSFPLIALPPLTGNTSSAQISSGLLH